jgi:hypothetical protein
MDEEIVEVHRLDLLLILLIVVEGEIHLMKVMKVKRLSLEQVLYILKKWRWDDFNLKYKSYRHVKAERYIKVGVGHFSPRGNLPRSCCTSIEEERKVRLSVE